MAKIAIYDSGVGGLSIYHEMKTALPFVECVFVSDNQAYPYGVKSEDQLLTRVMRVAESICDSYEPDILILACNTASTVCLPTLRERLSVPVVGVVPAIKPASELTETHVIGLLATPATVGRAYTDKLISDFAENCVVVKVGSKQLVDIAEGKLRGHTVCLNELRAVLLPFIKEQELDTLVLACTHFPLLQKEIKRVFSKANKAIALVDSGHAIAKRVTDLLENQLNIDLNEKFKSASQKSLNIASFTKKIESDAFVAHLKNIGFGRIERLNLIDLSPRQIVTP